MNLLSRYLSEVRKIRSLGAVPETSYYPPLSELLNGVGALLTPKVRCVVHPRSQGAGIPDLALFSADQIPVGGAPGAGVIPSRGVIEAKGSGQDVDKLAASTQVAKYLDRYGQVLVTNLWEFLLVTRDGPTERFRLAATEAEFWSGAGDAGAADHEAFAAYLRRVLLSDAPIGQPKDRADLKTIGILTRRDGAGLQDGDLAVTAGWGNQTKTGVMPGRGKVEEQPDGTLDIYLNDNVAWRGIPPAVWRYTIGGYQVMKKWLSYRELGVLGRPLTVDEATEVRAMARRIAELVGLSGRLDGNLEAVKGPSSGSAIAAIDR